MKIPRNPNQPPVLPDTKRTIARTAIAVLKAELATARSEIVRARLTERADSEATIAALAGERDAARAELHEARKAHGIALADLDELRSELVMTKLCLRSTEAELARVKGGQS